MPIYEYQCKKCDEEFECIVIGNDTVTCPKCNTKRVKRKMSACSHKSSGKGGDYSSSSRSTSSGCSSCSGGSCSSCH